VFRVDLALRPNGNSGPPAVSLAMLEDYLQAHGREWERFAWLKSRVVAPIASVRTAARWRCARSSPLRLSPLPRLRRLRGLRQLHAKVRDEAQRRAAGRPQRANDVKLSRGGIREIEFIVQLLLVGARRPVPRDPHPLDPEGARQARRRRPDEARQRRAPRRRVHAAAPGRAPDPVPRRPADHVLPEHDGDLAWIAASLGAEASGPCALLDRLGEAREYVAGEFDLLLRDGRGSTGNGCRSCGPAPMPVDAETFLAQLPPELAARVRPLCDQPKIRVLKDESKIRLAGLVGRAAQAAAEQRCTMQAAVQFLDWLEPLLRRESYLALLAERPEVQNRLLRLLGLARWPMRYLMLHPGVIDELADEELLHGRFDPAAYIRELEERHAGWQRSSQAEEELLLDTLRRAHHAEVFRTLVRDVEGHITVEQVADDLSALADATLACALRWSWST
jgi:glutamate-ammonia-ligase adenylyltransferase